MGSYLLETNAESFCGVIIDTLKELRLSGQPVTPNGLHKALSQKVEYAELLMDRGSCDSSPPGAFSTDRQMGEALEPVSGDLPPFDEGKDAFTTTCIKKLKDFRLDLLDAFENKLSDERHTHTSKLRELIAQSSSLPQILGLNADILDILKATSLCVNGELEQLTDLVTEIGRNLVEMESDLVSSFSCTRDTLVNTKEFNNDLARNFEDISQTIDISRDLAELKGFVASKLTTIKAALERKRKYDDLQLKRSAEEAKKLKRRISGLKEEIGRVQEKAKFLEEETLIDPLTGAYNRRAYEKRIQEELMRFNRNMQAFSILMIDIDHFKSINDQFGHWTGDRCLVELTKLIKKTLRGTDFFARYGGEEFIAILPGTDEQGLHIVANRTREFVERTRFLCQDKEVPLTISIGGTSVRPSDGNAEELFKRVDMAMYEAKKSGRNCSVIH